MYITMVKIGDKEYPVLTLPNRPKAILDSTLGEIYGADTREINQAVARNQEKFPEDFYFVLSREEFKLITEEAEDVTICDIFYNIKYNRVLPKAFTHMGCNMMATILKSETAIRRSIHIIRAFTRLEETANMAEDPMMEPQLYSVPEKRLCQLILADREIMQSLVYVTTDITLGMDTLRCELRETNRGIARLYAELQDIKSQIHSLELKERSNSPAIQGTISASQAKVLRNIVKYKGRNRSGMSCIWREFKEYFDLSRYTDLLASKYREAKEWLETW